jgi:hypothetical protein
VMLAASVVANGTQFPNGSTLSTGTLGPAPGARAAASIPPGHGHVERAWLACAACLSLVEVENRERLARQGARRLGREVDFERAVTITRRNQDDRFWTPRISGR